MNLPKTPDQLIRFLDEHLTTLDKYHIGFSWNLKFISRNADMFNWGLANALRYIDDRFVMFERRYIARCQSSQAIQFLIEYEDLDLDQDWIQKGKPNKKNNYTEESNIHYFWLSANSHPNAEKLIINRINNPIPFNADNGANIWWGMICKNTNINVLNKLFERIHEFEENQIIYNPETKWEHPYIINLGNLAENPSATEWVLENLQDYFEASPRRLKSKCKDAPEDIWKGISRNPHPKAIEFLRQHPLRVEKEFLAQNPNPEAIQLLQELDPSGLNKYSAQLSTNVSAIPLLQINQYLINYESLGSNPHPWAISTFAKWVMLHKNKKQLSECCIKNMFKYNQNDPNLYKWSGVPELANAKWS